MSRAAGLDQPGEGGQRRLADEQLPRIGAALFDDRGRFAPDQLGPAGAEAAVTADRQFVGRAVGGAVAALHRLHAEGVAGRQRPDRDRAKERGEVVGETEFEVKTVGLGFDVGDGLVFEIMGHRHVRLRESIP